MFPPWRFKLKEAQVALEQGRLAPGSIIARPIPGAPLAEHWMLLEGFNALKGLDVIHFWDAMKKGSNAKVRRDNLADVLFNQHLRLVASPVSSEHGEAMVIAALQFWKRVDNGFNGRYRLFEKNCQDFCVRCFDFGLIRLKMMERQHA